MFSLSPTVQNLFLQTLLLLSFSTSLSVYATKTDTLSLHLLNKSRYPLAVCNDGSPAGYYYKKTVTTVKVPDQSQSQNAVNEDTEAMPTSPTSNPDRVEWVNYATDGSPLSDADSDSHVLVESLISTRYHHLRHLGNSKKQPWQKLREATRPLLNKLQAGKDSASAEFLPSILTMLDAMRSTREDGSVSPTSRDQ